MKFGKWIVNNFWLKVISLLLAIFTWFYVVKLIGDATYKKTVFAKILPSYSKLVSKKLYVKAVLVGKLPDKFELLAHEVKVEPPYFVVAGPRHMLNKIDKLETMPIDISKYRRSVTVDAQIANMAQNVDTEKLWVKVVIPVKKITPQNTSEPK